MSAPAPAQSRPKTPPASRKVSLYRFRSSGSEDEVSDYVDARYLERDGFTARSVDIDGLEALLVTGTIAPGDANWCEPLSRLAAVPVSEQNQTSLGLLVVRTTRAVYGLSFGMGHLMIDETRIDPGFGIQFAVRCLDEDRITNVRRQVMDTRGRTDENASTGGEHIRGFGIEQFGEIVSKISGQIKDVPLTYCAHRKRAARITGSDRSLKLQLGTTGRGLRYDLEQIEQVCERSSVVPDLDFIAQVRPLDPKSEKAHELDKRLDALLGDPEGAPLALVVPGECRDHYESTESLTVRVRGQKVQYADLELEDLLALVSACPAGHRLRALRDGRITMYADSDEMQRNSRDVPADHWLSAEIADDAVSYFYLQHRWYEIGAEYLSVMESRIAALLAEPSTVTLPSWPAGRDEGWYNERVAQQYGYVLLDKKMIHTARLRGGGLEIADVLGPDGQLVCNKKATKTQPLNHLFAQARVAVETLRQDSEARAELLATVPDGHPVDRAFRAPVVVLGVLLKGGVPVTSSSLFAFAKVSLMHLATALESTGARLQVVSITRDSPVPLPRAPEQKRPTIAGAPS